MRLLEVYSSLVNLVTTLLTSMPRSKLAKNTSLDFPPELSQRIAKVSEGLSFAYLQEVFVSTMTSLVLEQEAGPTRTGAQTSTASGIESNIIWQTVKTQIEKIRKELLESRKSVDDAGKHSVSDDAASSLARPTGFGK